MSQETANTDSEEESISRPIKFFPDPLSFFSAIGINPKSLLSASKVQIQGNILAALITTALRNYDFDERAYIENNPDLAEACDKGEIQDIKLHYAMTGFFERRVAFSNNFDAEWYVNNYIDVAVALEAGEIENAADHYRNSGVFEWRLPCREAERDAEIWKSVLLGQSL